MLAACTLLKNAQKVKDQLRKKRLINQDYLPAKEMGYIYFPVLKKVKISGAEVREVKFTFERKKKEPAIEELLQGKLSPIEIQQIPKSQEVIGRILILEIPEELRSKEKIIAEAYLQANKSIETVVRKDEMYSGVYRTRKVKVLAGKNQKQTIHQENGIKMYVDIEETYFSARTANERLRIAKQVKKNEMVMVMFSGVSPFPLVIAKNSPAKKIYGIEINPLAHQLALQNIELNKMQDKIVLYEGDVCEIIPEEFKEQKFERIVMPLPKTSQEFLPQALMISKKGTIIHLYAFLAKNEIKAEGMKIKQKCVELGHQAKILQAVTCGQFSPKVFRICFDIKVEK